jgi:hypothetical protein
MKYTEFSLIKLPGQRYGLELTKSDVGQTMLLPPGTRIILYSGGGESVINITHETQYTLVYAGCAEIPARLKEEERWEQQNNNIA